jgi:hypothetical protein
MATSTNSIESDQSSPIQAIPLQPKAQIEAETLLSLLRSMTYSELAGYVASIISEEPSSSSSFALSIVDQFRQLSSLQQKATQYLLLAMDRLMEMQRLYRVDENTRSCSMYVSK